LGGKGPIKGFDNLKRKVFKEGLGNSIGGRIGIGLKGRERWLHKVWALGLAWFKVGGKGLPKIIFGVFQFSFLEV